MDRIQRTHERSRLGRLLIEKGIISEAQLNKAIEQQRQSGQKLGEILTEWNLATKRQINGVLRRQRNLRMATAVATALLGPIQAFAAAPAPVTQTTASQPAARSGGLQAMSEDELGDVTAQGITQDRLTDLAKHSADGDGLAVAVAVELALAGAGEAGVDEDDQVLVGDPGLVLGAALRAGGHRRRGKEKRARGRGVRRARQLQRLSRKSGRSPAGAGGW